MTRTDFFTLMTAVAVIVVGSGVVVGKVGPAVVVSRKIR